jgi:Protein of unknown function (DUF3168)
VTSKLGPSLDLQTAIVALLGADTGVQTLLGNPPRINPPQNDVWPGSYIVIGEGQTIADVAECYDSSQVVFDIHVWSQVDASFADCKRIVATIWDCFLNTDWTAVDLAETAVATFSRERETYMRDPDGTTLHGILTVIALTDPI